MTNRCRLFFAELRRTAKSILYSRREYLCFFLALLLVQILFWLILLSGLLNGALIRREAERLYDYHVEIIGLDSNQLALLENDPYTAFADEKVYTITKINAVSDVYGKITYQVNLRFGENRDTADFLRRYGNALRAARVLDGSEIIRETALGSAERDASNAMRNAYLAAILLSCAASALLIFLYQLRLSHYRFTFGIFMTFGADYSRLVQTAFAELLLLSLLALPLSLPCAAIIRWMISTACGAPFIFRWGTIPGVLLLNLGVVTAATRLPMKILSQTPPIHLILTRDNTASITSPRRSVNLLGSKRKTAPALPRRYAAVSQWRFRKLYARMLCSAALFSALGVFVFYLNDVGCVAENQPLFAATLHAGNRTIDDLPQLLEGLDGVNFLDLTYRPSGYSAGDPVSFSANRDLLLLPSERILPQFGGYFVGAAPGQSATVFAKYETITEDSIAALLYAEEHPEKVGCTLTIEGDPYRVLTEPNTVLLTDSIYNTQYLDLKPGDKIQIAAFKSGPPIDPLSTAGNMQRLMQTMLQIWKFDYHEYTVGAILHGAPAGQYLTVGLSLSDYAERLGETPRLVRIRAAVDPALTDTDRALLAADIDYLCSVWGLTTDVSAEMEAAFSQHNRQKTYGRAELFCAIAGITVTFSPIIWFFSQALFYAGRQGEFSTLSALGLPERRRLGLHLTDGCFCAVAAACLTLALDFSLTYLFYALFNHFLYAYGFVDLGFRFSYTLSPTVLLFCLAVSLVFGFASAVIPYAYSAKHAIFAKAHQFVHKLLHKCTQKMV
ncbi:MAG: hypothetical protein IKL84_00980 [Clostridia bacterium]|nr:hypothetical protein [Clostridia bacterium]